MPTHSSTCYVMLSVTSIHTHYHVIHPLQVYISFVCTVCGTLYVFSLLQWVWVCEDVAAVYRPVWSNPQFSAVHEALI